MTPRPTFALLLTTLGCLPAARAAAPESTPAPERASNGPFSMTLFSSKHVSIKYTLANPQPSPHTLRFESSREAKSELSEGTSSLFFSRAPRARNQSRRNQSHQAPMSGNDADQVVKLPPLVPDDAPAAAKLQKPEEAREDDTLAARVKGDADAVLARLASADCEPVIIVNFANGDMVGHTGSLEAATRAVEVVDACVGAIVDAALARGGSAIVTADHGNAEEMWDPRANCPHTAHTNYTVPCSVVGAAFKGRALRTDGPFAWAYFSPLYVSGAAVPSETIQSLVVGAFFDGDAVEPGFENRGDGAVPAGADVVAPLAGRFEPPRAIGVGQA